MLQQSGKAQLSWSGREEERGALEGHQHPIRLLSTDSASPLNHMGGGRTCLFGVKGEDAARQQIPHPTPAALCPPEVVGSAAHVERRHLGTHLACGQWQGQRVGVGRQHPQQPS